MKKMRNIILRKTIESDAEQYVKLGAKVWRSCYSHIMPKEVFDDMDARKNEKIKEFPNRINKYGSIDFVATDGDKIIAFAVGLVSSKYDYYQKLGYADLMAIYVDPEYQHFGIGKRLFTNIVSELKKLGKNKMVIGVLKKNLQARKAYEKWGGKLDNYESAYEKMGYSFPEVFYLYDLDDIDT